MKKRFIGLVITLVFLLFVFLIFDKSFGRVYAGSELHDIGFTGQRADDSTGLISFPYRTYDPDAGRFLQRDPSGYVDGENLYEYVSGNALGSVDELGLHAGAGFGRFLVRRLDELTKAGKIDASSFTGKMASATALDVVSGVRMLEKRAAEKIAASGGVSLADLKATWEINNDPYRQFIAGIGVHGITDLQIKVWPPYPYRSRASRFDSWRSEIHIGSVETATSIYDLDSAGGKMVAYWLSSVHFVDELDHVKSFRSAVDAELFATKGNVHQAIKNLDLLSGNKIHVYGYRKILEEAKKRRISLTNAEVYGVARYLHNIAVHKQELVSALSTEDIANMVASGDSYGMTPGDITKAEYGKLSQLSLNRFNDAIIEAKTGKLALSDTLVPEYVTHAERKKIINLLSKIENSR